ncbi:MAG: DUF4430 domain-containing protein [Patescibacteria group bacterium]|jgi:hypothetical protein
MRTKIKNFWVSLLMLAFIFQPAFVSAGVPEAVTYLKSQVDDPWITLALKAAGETSIPVGYLHSVSGNLATDYAKTILALAAVGENPKTFGTIDYVAKLKTYFSDNQMGDKNLLNDDAWSILALASVGEVNSPEASAAKNFLLAHQNVDGGWSYSVGAGSDTNDTAAAIMALVEAGVSNSDVVITGALAYIQSAQNADGGIGYEVGSDSDAGSDSWVISALIKAGVNPNSWNQNGKNPVTHLQSLQDGDGGFWWVTEGTSEWNNKAMTAFAVIALSNKTYPVGYYQNGSNLGTYHLRLEGSTSTICDTQVAGTNALDLVKNAAAICGYTYTITQESYGPYLRAINDEQAQGTSGWLYFVDNISPPIGADSYTLAAGDEVLFYYGEWGWNPTQLNASPLEIDPGEVVNVAAQYFNGTDWLPLPNAVIKVNEEVRTADASGHLTLTINQNGFYQVYIDTPGFIRSEKSKITVGDTVSQKVGLQVEINQSGGGNIGGEAIALVVDQSQLNFGTLAPGQTNSRVVNLTNGGTVGLNVGAAVSGDVVFVSGIKINDQLCTDYTETLLPNESKTAGISLTVPGNYLASGVKSGELIFWATSQ